MERDAGRCSEDRIRDRVSRHPQVSAADGTTPAFRGTGNSHFIIETDRGYYNIHATQEVAMTPKRTRPEAQEEARLIHIRLKPETHKRLRVRAAEEDVSIQDW